MFLTFLSSQQKTETKPATGAYKADIHISVNMPNMRVCLLFFFSIFHYYYYYSYNIILTHLPTGLRPLQALRLSVPQNHLHNLYSFLSL